MDEKTAKQVADEITNHFRTWDGPDDPDMMSGLKNGIVYALTADDSAEPDPFDLDLKDSCVGRLAWTCLYLRAIRERPEMRAATSPLKQLRDSGNRAAGLLFEILGDGFPLPPYPAKLIGQAAVFAVEYWDRMAAQIDRDSYEFRIDPFGPFRSRNDEIKDLFLRCLGVRRISDKRGGELYNFNDEALFWRRLHDLGGLG